MKKTALLVAAILGLLLTACVPDKQTEILDIGPDMDGKAGTPVDFDVLASDTMDGISDMEPFGFVERVQITGVNSEEGGSVKVTVGTIVEVGPEDAQAFAAAVMKSMGNAVANELLEYNVPEKDTFGDFWDKYSITFEFYNDTDLEGGEGKPYYVFEYRAGDTNPLNPNVDEYNAEYYKGKDILERNL